MIISCCRKNSGSKGSAFFFFLKENIGFDIHLHINFHVTGTFFIFPSCYQVVWRIETIRRFEESKTPSQRRHHILVEVRSAHTLKYYFVVTLLFCSFFLVLVLVFLAFFS